VVFPLAANSKALSICGLFIFLTQGKIREGSIYYNEGRSPFFGYITSLTENFSSTNYRNCLLLVNCKSGVKVESILSGKLLD